MAAALNRAGRDCDMAANRPGLPFLALEEAERLFHDHLVMSSTHAWNLLEFFGDMLQRHRGLAAESPGLKRNQSERCPEARGAHTRGKAKYVGDVEARTFHEGCRPMQARTIAEAVRRDSSWWPPLSAAPPAL